MALYTILFGLSLFLIALVVVIIKKMFFHWREEQKTERLIVYEEEHPAVSIIIYAEKCVIRRRQYPENQNIYDVITKSDISLTKQGDFESVSQVKLTNYNNLSDNITDYDNIINKRL